MPFIPRATALAFLVLVQAAPTYGQAPPMTGAEASFVTRLVDVRCVGFGDRDGPCDRVLLLGSETLDGMVDLLIVPAHGDEEPMIARDFAVHGPFDGQQARLEETPEGRLLVRSQQATHGRHPWFETLTIARHGSRFQVVGYHFSTYDRAMGGDLACHIDLVTGNWQVSATRVDPETGDVTRSWDVAQQGYPDETEAIWWSYREPPAHCDEVMEDWYAAAP